MKPLVAVDADVLGRRRTGDETYVNALLRELPALADRERLAAVTRHPELVPEGVEAVELAARSQVLRMAVRLPRLLRRLRPELAHFLYVVPPGYRGRSVVTVHDLSFEHFPDVMSFKDRLLFKTQVPRSARRADRVLTGSEWTKRDLLERYGLLDDRVVVTPYGVDPIFAPNGPRSDGRYILFVGAVQPRKDPLTAIEAFALLDDDLKLVFVGPNKLDGKRVKEAVLRHGLLPRFEWREYLQPKGLAAVYRGAACLVFPSRYEGFGLPVLEAMASGTPVVATTAGAVPEVAGEAAILVPPGNPEALAAGIEQALADRDRLVAAGLARARLFSWPEAARRTLAVYRELL
jgi:glycosyltransferase involved in cell wall biosynthesis